MRASKTKTEIRQDQIATAALELMAQHGPKSLNLAALARKVGVVPSAIYRHVQLIRNKIAIPRVVMSEEVFSGHAKRRQRVHGIIQAYLGQVAGRTGRPRGQGGIGKASGHPGP